MLSIHKPAIVTFAAAFIAVFFVPIAQSQQAFWPCFEGDLIAKLTVEHEEKVVARGLAGPYPMLLLASKKGSWTIVMRQPSDKQVYCIAASGTLFSFISHVSDKGKKIKWSNPLPQLLQ